MAERTQWWIERWLERRAIYLCIYLSSYLLVYNVLLLCCCAHLFLQILIACSLLNSQFFWLSTFVGQVFICFKCMGLWKFVFVVECLFLTVVCNICSMGYCAALSRCYVALMCYCAMLCSNSNENICCSFCVDSCLSFFDRVISTGFPFLIFLTLYLVCSSRMDLFVCM